MDILAQIIAKKRLDLDSAKRALPIERLRTRTLEARVKLKPHALLDSSRRNDRVKIIAEFKRCSPSKGMISEDADAATVTRSYELAGATAVSVLTETNYFCGSLDDLRTVRDSVSIPILRKDFIFEEYQIYESAAAGANALLLIVAAVDDKRLERLRMLTEDELGMDALIEVHTKDEMERAAATGATIIGVNNRDLRTFEVSTQTSKELAQFAPADAILISESGLNPSEVGKLYAAGYKGFLVGETLMRAEDPEQQLRALMGEN